MASEKRVKSHSMWFFIVLLTSQLMLAPVEGRKLGEVSDHTSTQNEGIRKPDCYPSTPTPFSPMTPSTPSTPSSPSTPSAPSTPSTPSTPSHGYPPSSGSTPHHGNTPSHHGNIPSHGGTPAQGSDPNHGTTPSHGGTPSTPSHGGTPSTPSHGGGGYYNSPTVPVVTPPSTPSTPTPLVPGITPPSTPSTPTPLVPGITPPSTPSTPTPLVPGTTPPSTPYTPTPLVPGTTPPSTPFMPTPLVPLAPTPPVFPLIPTPPTTPVPFDPSTILPGTCYFWATHPMLIFNLLGYFGTMGGAFSPVATTTFGENLSFPEALSNTRTDGIGALFREGTASLLNSMVDNKFPFTTQQVRDAFMSSLHSNRAAVAQAKVFKKANEGHFKHK